MRVKPVADTPADASWKPNLGAIPEASTHLEYFERDAGPSLYGFEPSMDKLVRAEARFKARKQAAAGNDQRLAVIAHKQMQFHSRLVHSKLAPAYDASKTVEMDTSPSSPKAHAGDAKQPLLSEAVAIWPSRLRANISPSKQTDNTTSAKEHVDASREANTSGSRDGAGSRPSSVLEMSEEQRERRKAELARRLRVGELASSPSQLR